MQIRIFLLARDVRVGFEKERRRVERVAGSIDISAAMELVGAGGGAHVNVRATRGALLRVIHAGVDAKLLNGFGGRSRNGLADSQIGRSGRLYFCGAELGGSAHTSVVDHARGGDLAGAFAVEQIAGVDAVEQEGVAGIALAVGPDRHVAKAGIYAGAAGKLGVDARGENSEPGETTGGKRSGFDLAFVEDVAVGGVGGVEQRRCFDNYSGIDLTDFESDIDSGSAVGLNGNGGKFLSLKTVMREGERVGADGKIDEIIAAAGVRGLSARELSLIVDEHDLCSGQSGAGSVRDRAGNATESLLRQRGGSQEKYAENREQNRKN
jgi:hypothetical protein